MTDYSGDDYGREQDRHDQQPSGDWTAPGSTPEYPPSYGTDHGGDVPGQSQGYGGQAYGAGNGRYGDAVAPMGAAPSGAMTRVGPGGVPELWPGPIPLRPMQFGEIIETAFRVLRFNPKTFFGLTFVVLAVTMLVASLVTWAILAAVGGSADVFAVSENGDMPGGMLLQFASAAIGLVSAFLSGMLIVPIGESALGRRLGAGESWHRIKGRLLPLLGYMLLSGLISLVLIIPLVAALVTTAVAESWTAFWVSLAILLPLTIAAYAWVTVTFSLAPAAIVLEGVGPITAIKRSMRLVRGSFWRTFGLLAVASIIASVIGWVLMVVLMLVMAGLIFAAASGGDASTVGLVTMIFYGLMMLITYTISLPLSAAANALIYMDRRFRTEALAVDLLAEAERSR